MRKIGTKWQILLNGLLPARRSRKHSLRWLADEARKEQCKSRKTNLLRMWLKEAYYPSLKSFFMVLPLPLLFYVISRSGTVAVWLHFGSFRMWWIKPLDAAGTGYSNLIAIHAGIGIIIFALVIFIAESLRDDDAKDRARVLLKESFLFPLAVAEILTFFTFIWGTPNLWSVLPVFAIGMVTIFSLSRIIIVLINKHRLAEKRTELLRDRLAMSFGIAIRERFANNILISSLEKPEIKLKFQPYLGGNTVEFYDIYATKFGIVADIDLHFLGKIGDYIDRQAIRNGFAFSGDTKPSLSASPETSESAQESVNQDLKPNSSRYLVKKFHDVVSPQSGVFLRVDKRLLEGAKDLNVLHSLVKKAFSIEQKDNFTEEMRIEISGVRDQLLAAISARHLGKVKELTTLYRNLGDESLDLITQCGGGYSAEMARIERFSLGSGWEQVGWLSSDIYDFYRASVRSEDAEIVRDVTYLPVAIAIKAIEKNDHFVFQEFVDFAKYTYSFALKERNDDIRQLLVDRSWRYLKEMSMVYLDSQLHVRGLEKARVDSLRDFSLYLLAIFQDLLKQSLDAGDIVSFRTFLREFEELLDDIEIASQLSISRFWRLRLRRPDLSTSESEEIRGLLDSRDRREVTQEEIADAKQQVIFGLASWIFDLYKQDTQNAIYKECYELVQLLLPSNIEDFTALFLSVHSFEVEAYWGWDRWEMREREGVYTIQILEKLERFYAVKCLYFLSSESASSIEQIILPYDREFASLAKGNRELIPTIRNIEINPDMWRFVLSEPMLSATPLFTRLLQKAEKMQESDELQKLRVQPLSAKRVQEFKDDFANGFKETVTLRAIFSHYGRLTEIETGGPFRDEVRFGINTVEDKGAFVDESPVIYYEWGRDYGRNFARSEDAFIIEQIVPLCSVLNTSASEFDNLLGEAGESNDLLIVGVNVGFWDYFEGNDKFHSKWNGAGENLEPQNIDGHYEATGVLVPIFEIHDSKFQEQIIILKKSKLGFIYQMSPLNEGEDAGQVEGDFYKDVTSFSADDALMQSFLDQPPMWLQSKGSLEEQRLYLQTRVRLQLFERIKFDAQNFQGLRILVS